MTNIEDLAYRFRWQIAFLLVGITLAAGGVFLTLNSKEPEIEIITSDDSNSSNKNKLVVEVSGAVEQPGVYELNSGARIEDAIVMAGGISSNANLNWIERYLNRASFINDGQKIYIPAQDEQTSTGTASNSGGNENISNVLSSENETLININASSQSELETLSGIGPVYAQKIIENRPYSTVDELDSKSVIPKSTFEKIKNRISVY